MAVVMIFFSSDPSDGDDNVGDPTGNGVDR